MAATEALRSSMTEREDTSANPANTVPDDDWFDQQKPALRNYRAKSFAFDFHKHNLPPGEYWTDKMCFSLFKLGNRSIFSFGLQISKSTLFRKSVSRPAKTA